ncbi:MAG: sensor histidine kinase [Candidatus Alkaliphilus sp. MAG34]|nr:GHKL domain-containing protein [Clostridiales bacterium]
MQWYEGTTLAVLQMLSVFLVFGKLNRETNLAGKKCVFITLIALVLITVFFIYEINVGFLINYIVVCIMLILLFGLPIRKTVIRFAISIITIATIEFVFAYILFWVKGFRDVSFNGLFMVDSAVVITSVLINRFAEFGGFRQYVLQHRNYMIIVVINVTGVILLLMYMWKINESSMQKYMLHILIAIIVWEALNVYFLYQSIKIKQQRRAIDAHKRYAPFLKSMIHEIRQKQHDFKNHLNMLYMIVQIENDRQAREKIKEYIEKLLGSIEPIDKLLDIEDQILNAIIYSKRALAEKKNICFEVEIKEEVPGYPLERYEFVELVGNLLDNAIEAAEGSNDGNSKIILTLGIDEGFKIIETRNTGTKIQQSDIDKMFKRGFSTKKGEHRGYGLYNIKKIVEHYNGTIELFLDDDFIVFKILFQEIHDCQHENKAIKNRDIEVPQH